MGGGRDCYGEMLYGLGNGVLLIKVASGRLRMGKRADWWVPWKGYSPKAKMYWP